MSGFYFNDILLLFCLTYLDMTSGVLNKYSFIEYEKPIVYNRAQLKNIQIEAKLNKKNFWNRSELIRIELIATRLNRKE